MARDDPHFRLRIPEALRNRIADAAFDNHRSLNAEIVARLSATLDMDDAGISWSNAVESPPPDGFYEHLDKIVERTIRMVREEERKAGLPSLSVDAERERWTAPPTLPPAKD